MSNNDVRVGFLKQKCLETTPGGWQRRRRNVFAQLVPRGQETWKARLSTVDSVKVGTTRCLRNVEPADQVDQQHGRRVLGIAARFRIGLCTSVSRFCTRYALFPDNCQNCLTFEGLNEIELHRYSLNFDSFQRPPTRRRILPHTFVRLLQKVHASSCLSIDNC